MSNIYLMSNWLVSQFYRTLPYPTASFAGQTIIVTGANINLGLEASRHFARQGAAKVVLACRDPLKGEAAKRDIEASTGAPPGVVEVWQVDLASFESVKRFCREAEGKLDRLDVLVANAGVISPSFRLVEGFESTVAVNVVATYLMLLMLLPKLRATAARFNVAPHACVVSSEGHFAANFHERKADSIFGALNDPAQMRSDRYFVSKLLEVLVNRELASALSRHGGGSPSSSPVILNALTPGLCRTQLWRDMPFPLDWVMWLSLLIFARAPEMGSRAIVAAATAGEESHGKYMENAVVWPESRFVRSEEGRVVQKRVYDELMAILEKIEPGVTKNT